MKRHAWFYALPFLFHGAFSEEPRLTLHGAAWTGFGRIVNSEYTKGTSTDYNDNWLQQSGAVASFSSRINDNWAANFGVGTAYVHLPRGSKGAANLWYPFWVAFVPEMNFNYGRTEWFSEASQLDFTLGKFSYSYNRDSKNLGNYLLNGYVYPNILVSAQGNLAQAPKSAMGSRLGLTFNKAFKNELLLLTETEYAPLYDISVADVITFNAAPGVEIGGGVNFSRVYQQSGSDCIPSELGQNARNSKGEGCQVFVPDAAGNIFVLDANGNPTDSIRQKVSVPRSGIKVMGRLSLDPKQWFGDGSFGKNELILYSEVAVLGLKNYPVYYDDIMRRIPVMVGFNFPTFGLFNLSAEVEYFASKNSSNSLNAESGATAPLLQQDVDTGRDDWKYSVNASKVLAGSVEISGMVANDHIRLGGTHNVANGLEALNTLSDWYWTTKVAYFF
jgi:hypothetical protein